MSSDYLSSYGITSKVSTPSLLRNFLDAIPSEGVICLIASLAVRIFSESLFIPFFGLGISIIATTLVLKTIDCYDDSLLINVNKKLCEFNNSYPNLQLIAFTCAIVLGFISGLCSGMAGISLGVFGSIILNIENYKHIEQANRKLSSKY